MITLIIYTLLLLTAINGLLFVGIRNERIRNRRIMRQIWKLAPHLRRQWPHV